MKNPNYMSISKFVYHTMGLFLSLFVLVQSVSGEGKTMKCHYFGNSLTGQTAPDFHTDLAAGRNDVWEAKGFGVAGGRLWHYVNLLFPQYPDMAYPDQNGSRPEQNALEVRQTIENDSYDKIVIQPHQMHLRKYANWLDREAGDIEDGGKLVEWLREHQPDAQIYFYQTWAVPRCIDGDQENPDWEIFDYETYWLRPYDDPAPEGDPDPAHVMRTKEYHKKLVDTLNINHAESLGDQPIQHIPVGDVYLELERRLKNSTFVDSEGNPFILKTRTVVVDNENDKNLEDVVEEVIPLENVNIFYADFQHQNPGLPRFLHAATFYAVLFNEEPSGLDYSKYNVFPKKQPDGTFSESNYNWKGGDHRKFIEITPELADVLADVIWDVVSGGATPSKQQPVSKSSSIKNCLSISMQQSHITLNLTKKATVKIDVTDISGRSISSRTFTLGKGIHQLPVFGNNAGRVATGLYYMRLTNTDGSSITKSIVNIGTCRQ